MSALCRSLIVGLALFVGSSAQAQSGPAKPTKEAMKSAAALFQTGQRLYAKGRFEEAIKAFSGAHRLAPHRSALFNVARCNENLGRLKEALDAYRRTLAISQSAAHRAEVTQRIELLSRRPTKVFVASDPPGAEVRIDGRTAAESQRTPLVVALRPGEHLLLLRKAGFHLAPRRVEVILGKEQTITVQLRELPRATPCPAPQSRPAPKVIAPPALVKAKGVHVHISLLAPIIVTQDRNAEAGPGIQLHITVGRFLFGAHLLMNFQSQQPYSKSDGTPSTYDKESFRRLIPELEGGWVFPFRNLYFYTTLGLGFHIDRPIFVEENGADLVREWFAFAWSGGGGVEILANRWISLGAGLRLGMAHGDRASGTAPDLADSTHHFPWFSFWAGFTVHL